MREKVDTKIRAMIDDFVQITTLHVGRNLSMDDIREFVNFTTYKKGDALKINVLHNKMKQIISEARSMKLTL